MNKSPLVALCLTLILISPSKADPGADPPPLPENKTILLSLPKSAFDRTTEGISRRELDTLAVNLESDNWKVIDSKQGQLTIECKHPSSLLRIYAYSMGPDTALLTHVINERATFSETWIHKTSNRTTIRKPLLPEVSINDFYSKDDKVADPANYRGNVILEVKDDGTLVYGVYAGMNKNLDGKPVAYAVAAFGDGNRFKLSKKPLQPSNH